MPFWEDRVKDDWQVFFEGFAHGPSSCIECISDTDRDREPLRRLRLVDQSQYGLSSIQPDALTGAGHVAQQAAFARIELRAIRRIGGDADRYGQVVDDRLEVFLAPRRVATVPATPIAPEPDGGRVGVQTPSIAVPHPP